jgi:arylsulfatase A-like enzyme
MGRRERISTQCTATGRWARRSSFLCASLVVALGSIGCESGEESIARPPERVVLIVADTLRRDHIGIHGGPVPTPNIDGLAERGQVFGHAFSSYHQTTMSMAALFTGHTPSIERGRDRERLDWTGETWCGLERHARADDPGQCIPAGVETLAEAFARAGYWTSGVVSNRLLYRPGGYERGFDAWEEISGNAPTAGLVNQAVFDSLKSRPGDRFFLYVHFMDVHDYKARGHVYARGVQIVDRAVGRVESMLGQLGLLEGSVVIFTSDHGEHFEGVEHFMPANQGHTGSPSFEALLKVPLIISPALFRNENTMLRSDGLHRMIRTLAGLEPGPEPELAPAELYLSEREFQTYRAKNWKSFRHRESGRHFIVNLRDDPGETRNVAGSNPEIRAAHASRMDVLARELGAPDAVRRTLSESDRERLEALGYTAGD